MTHALLTQEVRDALIAFVLDARKARESATRLGNLLERIEGTKAFDREYQEQPEISEVAEAIMDLHGAADTVEAETGEAIDDAQGFALALGLTLDEWNALTCPIQVTPNLLAGLVYKKDYGYWVCGHCHNSTSGGHEEHEFTANLMKHAPDCPLVRGEVAG